ncbi:hypothetical protein FRC12_009389 [Ceratobasidium sp. 428]|nr:hypothetical protein FRC12_009389 [Ceratobasidium sp. 428]
MRANHIIFSGLASFLGLVGLVSAAVPLYGQCGGIGYTGETTCVAGAVCVYSNDYYSQCLAGTVTTTVTTKSTTTSRTTASAATTTSKTTTSTASAPSGSIPAGAITVGSGGKYSTIAAALKDTSSNVYYIYAGTYKEQILISRANVKSEFVSKTVITLTTTESYTTQFMVKHRALSTTLPTQLQLPITSQRLRLAAMMLAGQFGSRRLV